MNFFGVGGPELIAILIIMLVIAGPKRMIHWSYLMGQYVAKFRVIWSQTVDLVQKEFDEAGVDIKLPKTPPNRSSMNKAISEAIKPVTQPVQESIDEIKKDTAVIKDAADALNSETAAKKDSWSNNNQPNPPAESQANGKPSDKADLGAWSAVADEQET